MIVKCTANSGADLPVSQLSPSSGFTERTDFPLSLGRTYHVFALTLFLGGTWYFVLDDDNLDWPVWAPAELFEIVDGSLPVGWRVGEVRGDRGLYPVISFEEWADDPGFYERLVDGEPRTVEIFKRRRAEIEGRDSPGSR